MTNAINKYRDTYRIVAQVSRYVSVIEIALVPLSETSDYLPGQVNNPLAVIRRTSEKVTSLFYLPLKLQQSRSQLMTHRTNTAKITPSDT